MTSAGNRGVVITFDASAGLGTVRTDEGRDLGFHCTQIADGTRNIAEGAAVTFEVIAGRHGRWEGANLRPQPPDHPLVGSAAERAICT